MKVNQRDIVEIAFFTGIRPEPHPAIIVSSNAIFEAEGFFYAVLLSTKNHFPDFTIEIDPQMVNNARNLRSGFAVCHMLQIYTPDQIISRTGSTLKKPAFQDVISKITEVIFQETDER